MPTTNLMPLVTRFNKAATKLKYPRIRTEFAPDSTLVIKLSGPRAKYPGSLTLTNGLPYGDPEQHYYGRIATDGSLHLFTRDLTQIAAELLTAYLQQLSADPAKVALAYGNKTCNCMFCGRRLDTNESRHNGYGPICADKWDLPWGGQYEQAKTASLLVDL